MTSPDHSLQAEIPRFSNERAGVSTDQVHRRKLRIERIGKRLFNVPNRIVTLRATPPKSPAVPRSMTTTETAVCHGIQFVAKKRGAPRCADNTGIPILMSLPSNHAF